jgi:SPP1 family phage portal protein
VPTVTEQFKAIIEAGAGKVMSLEEIINLEIDEWLGSSLRQLMLTGQRYYESDPDILQRQRTVIGPGGQAVKAENLANNRLVHNFVRKLVDQKVGYLFGLPMAIQTDNQDYLHQLGEVFDKRFLRLFQNLGREAVNKGKAWLHVYYDQDGHLAFARIPAEEIIPLWRDSAHTDLQAVIRVYEVEAYEGKDKRSIIKVEFWDTTGVRRYVRDGDGLIEDVEAGGHGAHFSVTTGDQAQGYNWERVPFICFKYNDDELPFIRFVKTLVDDYDARKSDNTNNLEDLPNSVYVIKNYDGADLGEFRRNLSAYRAVKVSDDGGVETLSLEIDTEAYKTHVEMTRKDIYEFGRGVDTQSERFGGDKSGIALRFLYADLDMDANIIETEFQAGLEQLRWFVDQHLANASGSDFSREHVDFILNRDIIINETDVISNAKSSVGIISDETIVANHPWVTDLQAELGRLKEQKAEAMEQYRLGPPATKQGGGGE